MTKEVDFSALLLNYNSASVRLILLDYDGTLAPFEVHPGLAIPSTTVKTLLTDLAADRRNHIILISGRDKENLAPSWSKVPIILAAEHGGYYRNPGNSWRRMFSNPGDWVARTLPALNSLSFQYEGSFVEAKSYSLAWHYRAISDRISEPDKRQILAAIRSLPDHDHFIIYDQEYTIELRTPGIDKGSFVARWMSGRHYDFIMAIGDGKTDEDLFKIFGDSAYTIKVGESEHSAANFHFKEQEDVLPFIEKLQHVSQQFDKTMARTGLQNGQFGMDFN